MATESEKKSKLIEMEGISIYGLTLSLWELFGEASFATSQSMGDYLLTFLEAESGLEIEGENPENILKEVTRLLTDEVGLIDEGKSEINGDRIKISCVNCGNANTSNALVAQGVQPFYCPVYSIVSSAMRERLGKKNRFAGRTWDEESKTCTLEIQLMQ